ncbi:MAG: hypothetical protein KAV45_13485 [Calditrichia bacterium]|nr:hypothetical protein [Calditrichia bacterium]
MGSKVMSEEPCEGNLHVRICGGSGWATAASTRNSERKRVPVSPRREGRREFTSG